MSALPTGDRAFGRRSQKAIRSVHIRNEAHTILAALLALAVVAGGLGVASAQTAAEVDTPAPTTEVSAEIMYRILVGDIALQRGEPAIAARAYYEAAEDAQDATLARRATEIALFARQRSVAVDAAQLWQKLDPSSDRAQT
jgi:hypothetical protein